MSGLVRRINRNRWRDDGCFNIVKKKKGRVVSRRRLKFKAFLKAKRKKFTTVPVAE